MASRNRRSTATPAPRRSGNEMPPYEPPKFPLNPAGQRALAQLTHTHNLRKLDESLKEAQAAITNAAAEINDRLLERQARSKRREPTSSAEHDNDAHDDFEQNVGDLDEMCNRVDNMTHRMDESMRKIIDTQHSVQFVKDSLASTMEDARANASTQVSTQNIRSQRRRQRAGIGGDDGDDGDDEYQDFEPTDPAAGTQTWKAPLDFYRAKMEDATVRYQSHSRTQRYADNNAYRDFRRVVHHAQHPDGEVQLPHQSEWFAEDGPGPAPGVTTRARVNADDDEDDDIAVSKTRISTKCPLTLVEFKTPLTSKKCPHSFEEEAIKNMINARTNTNRLPNGKKYVQCPVGGCSQTLSEDDLHADPLLMRMIKRIQRARQLESQENADEDGKGRSKQNGATVIEDGDDGVDVVGSVESRAVKTEAKSSLAVRPPPSTAPRSSAVVDLGSSTEDEADEDDTMED